MSTQSCQRAGRDGALLDLVKEERVIVRQALGLELESDE